MRIFLVATGLIIIIALTACGSHSTLVPESAPRTSKLRPEESRPALLLSEDSAVSILQAYLQDCVLSWDVEHESLTALEREMERGAPVPSEQEKKWWMDLATGATGGIAWSARYHGVTELSLGNISAETWVVIGPGFERAGSELAIVPGRWKVYAGRRIAEPLDAPARLAIEEYKKPLDPYFDSHCSGYSER